MTTEGKNEAQGMDSGDDEALWNLLGRQEPPVKASPYFARRVLREIADERPARWSLRSWRFWTLTPRYAAAWSGAFALGVLCLSAVLTIPASHPPSARLAAATTTAVESSAPASSLLPPVAPEAARLAEVAPVQDAELIADLDNILNREESRLWTDDTDTARF